MSTIYSFAPIANASSRVLILGSMPGAESLRKQQYYGYTHNTFWRVLYTLLYEPFSTDYEQRKQFVLKSGIALWDVIASCEREGSLDARIRNPKTNDFASFFAVYPSVRQVFFNGKTAHNIFKRQVGFDFDGLKFTTLGSTSPAHAVPFETRLADWRKILG